MNKFHTCLGFVLLVVTALFGVQGMAQEIVWSAPVGIAGDANLSTNGTGFDALILDTSAGSSLAADGITFNVACNRGSGVYGDGLITVTASGLNNYRWPGAFPTNSQASAAFAAIMDAGGTFQF